VCTQRHALAHKAQMSDEKHPDVLLRTCAAGVESLQGVQTAHLTREGCAPGGARGLCECCEQPQQRQQGVVLQRLRRRWRRGGGIHGGGC